MAYLTWIPWRSTLTLFLGMHFLRQAVSTHVANVPYQPVGVFDFQVCHHLGVSSSANHIKWLPVFQDL
ncbi:hypothetical protein BE845_11585 [Legionella pneumophila subsp. pneumophila]|nr:hypothetical protein BE841_01125 [Legionella pneumophila subsp. pneumophila]AOW55242.1 hypothetical protein BE842_07630 [Legionella pneumophila subsp. pneumophila]AOW64663.1 hypothetical protein BE845_11585 [Legionella pneumophila subsp. pneumophila]